MTRLKQLVYNILMRINKDGSPDKRFKKKSPKKKESPTVVEMHEKSPKELLSWNGSSDTFEKARAEQDPNILLARLLEENGLRLDFDVVEGSLPTKHGIIKLEKPTLVVKASYV